MDKIAMYEMLLEEHPLWNKEAYAPGAQIFKFAPTGRLSTKVMGARKTIRSRAMPYMDHPRGKSLINAQRTRYRQGQASHVPKPKDARDSARVFMRKGYKPTTPARPLTPKQKALKDRLSAKFDLDTGTLR